MEEILTRYRNVALLIVLVIGQLVLLGYQVRNDHNIRLLRVWTVGAVTPIGKSLHGFSEWARSGWENYIWLIDAGRENQQLRREINQLRLENDGLRRNLERLEREEKLVAYQQELASQTVLAEVIGVGANANSKEIFLGRGLEAGIRAGMPVITPEGIVGKVLAAFQGASLALLINDLEAGVGVVLANSRAQGVMKGTGSKECTIDYISHEVPVQIGETVYTSGNDRIFPKALRVGTVSQLERGTDFQEIHVRLFAALNRLDEVLVITSGVHQELPAAAGPQPPKLLLPAPPSDVSELLDADRSGGAGTDSRGGAAPASGDAALGSSRSAALTDADRLKERYRAIAEAQGHRLGEAEPGSPPPDFNRGLARAARTDEAPPAAAGPPADPSSRRSTVLPQIPLSPSQPATPPPRGAERAVDGSGATDGGQSRSGDAPQVPPDDSPAGAPSDEQPAGSQPTVAP